MPGRSPWASRGAALLASALLLAALPVIGAAFPGSLRVPRLDPARMPGLPSALFSHRTHGAFGCYACHPATFPEGAVGFTHDDMNRGRFCGRCHDGRLAFSIKKANCDACHVQSNAGAH
jgi:c(7)-type cytochrome triheme protein